MPLTQADLEGIQADAMADDVEIDLEKMSLWTTEQAITYFESGGEVEPRQRGRGTAGVGQHGVARGHQVGDVEGGEAGSAAPVQGAARERLAACE